MAKLLKMILRFTATVGVAGPGSIQQNNCPNLLIIKKIKFLLKKSSSGWGRFAAEILAIIEEMSDILSLIVS